MKGILAASGRFFAGMGGFFAAFFTAFSKGDAFVKLSLLWWGAGCARRKQYAKALLLTALEALLIWFSATFAPRYVSKFATLGVVKFAQKFDPVTMRMINNDYDHSFLILLYSLFSFVIWFAGLLAARRAVIQARRLQEAAARGERVPTFAEEARSYLDEKFHVALLALPVLGIIAFTVVPILLLVFVAFTNYDQQHMPPGALFTWVGLDNFASLFSSGGLTVTFAYAFRRVLAWTIVWAFFSTLTTYFGGIFMSLLLNSPKTVAPKLWRLLLVITIAVPQFVSLLLVRNFFANTGIVNTLCAKVGLTAALRGAGLISTSYIPFLSAPGWAHVMIILINIWIGVPYQMLICTGVLMNLPEEQLESARMDGASGFQIFRYITMPFLLQVTGPSLVTDFVRNINNFNVIYLLTQDFYVTTNQMMANSHAKEVDLLVTWLFNLTQNHYNYKMSAVIGVMVFLICAAFTLTAFNAFIGGDREGAYQ